MRRVFVQAVLVLVVAGTVGRGQSLPRFKIQEIDSNVGKVCYALTSADVNNDTLMDIVALTEDALVWYENPSWTKHEIMKGQTEPDNVCIVTADLNRDRKVDFVVGAGWKPSDTQKPGTLQWVGRDKEGTWQVHPINCAEPTIHRMTWASVPPGRSRKLIVAPLQGRGTKGPNWGVGDAVKILAYSVPQDPTSPDWPVEVIDESLHTVHNVAVSYADREKSQEIFLASWEGVFMLDRDTDEEPWRKIKIGEGNQLAQPFKGASEVRVGWLGGTSRYVATIEPWHGSQVVVYTPDPKHQTVFEAFAKGDWIRKVISEPVSWGHAVACIDLDGDTDDELIIGQRDPNPDGVTPRGPGLLVFDPVPTGKGQFKFVRYVLDDGGMACEDLMAIDLDADGDNDIVAGGRATHNVRIYWNLGDEAPSAVAPGGDKR